MSSTMNHTLLDTASPCELPQSLELSIFTQVIASLLNLIYSDSAGLVWIVSNIMWAVVEHRIALHLTAPLSTWIWEHTSERYEPRTQDLSSPSLGDLGEDIIFYASCCLLHLVLYFDFVKCDTPLGSHPPDAFINCLMLVFIIPHNLYADWPIVSMVFIVSWAHIWSRNIYLAVAGIVFLQVMLFLTFYTYTVLGDCRAILSERVKKSPKMSRILLWFQGPEEKDYEPIYDVLFWIFTSPHNLEVRYQRLYAITFLQKKYLHVRPSPCYGKTRR
ncbi:uncharacterized protein TRIREDRAFT_110733 [Trichoderma reesei QM6a]|uniref:Predicted protein n=1 Tax=Hypocrea jecorina (strain QM6a) TaxID=431241 RepID=G0RST2_HYPJQ|nr:uncharacterized protein TRIREDRAFT_110733 [Trichoderma reesei QM6a]EGR45736.1 predicted protein [Trichoderma reesei QM6a]